MLFVKIFYWEIALNKIQDVWIPSSFCLNPLPSPHTNILLEGGGLHFSVPSSFLLLPSSLPSPFLLNSSFLFLAVGSESLPPVTQFWLLLLPEAGV